MDLYNYYIIKIQKIYRGYLVRRSSLPLILHQIKTYLKCSELSLFNNFNDGRINSSIDENNIIGLLLKKFENRIKIPKIRMWYDILLYDKIFGWIPVNIKTTNMNTRDNVGNLTLCVYSYTNFKLNLDNTKTYYNGIMSKILISKIHNKEYNKNYKKDYYFLVINKNNSKDIIINSIKGLNKLYPNTNNLPFQICWNKNKEYKYDNISSKINLFINCLLRTKKNWKEQFLQNFKKRKFITEFNRRRKFKKY